ncbi:MAG: Asparagine synthetase [glutamine-hydrolyzing] 1 [Chlamydiae bacterium]|nr:Asparagine synthetase [glutamine-hydrolyzing] 1 [Chlamydiota bacterium]
MVYKEVSRVRFVLNRDYRKKADWIQGKMRRIGGILYPSPFEVTDLLGATQEVVPSSEPVSLYRYKNLELAGWEVPYAVNEKKTTRVFFDGRLVNKTSLQKELKEKHGFPIRGINEAELVVYAYEFWDEEFLEHLSGPFVLALFDEEKGLLFLARDRIGEKPLFWISRNPYWLFSTELRGLLATGLVPQTPSLEAFASYLYFGFIPQDLSAIQGVNKLLPGHYLKINLKRQSSIEQYWSYSKQFSNKTSHSVDETYHKMGEKMEIATRMGIPHTGNVGSILQGNLGSSALSWFLSHEMPRERLHGYTISFEEPYSPELETAKMTAKTLSIQHKTATVSPDLVFRDLPKIIWNLDEPNADPYIAQTWFLAKTIGETCRYAFSDLGSDEVLGGSSRYYLPEKEPLYPPPPLAYYLSRLPEKIRDKCLLPFIEIFSSSYKYRILRNIEINREQVAYLMHTALFKGKGRRKASPELFQAFDPEVFSQRFHKLTSLPGSKNGFLYYDAKTELPDKKLSQYERLFSAHNVELIHPYLDTSFVEFMAGVPEEMKFSGEAPAPILRNLMTRLCHECPPFPERKDSYLDTWCENPQFRFFFFQLLEGRLVEEGLISAKWIRTQLKYPKLLPRTFRQLWAILNLEVWFRLYIHRPLNPNTANLTLDELFLT